MGSYEEYRECIAEKEQGGYIPPGANLENYCAAIRSYDRENEAADREAADRKAAALDSFLALRGGGATITRGGNLTRRKATRRKSTKRKSMKRKSMKRKSMKRKAIRRKSMKRKNTRRRRR